MLNVEETLEIILSKVSCLTAEAINLTESLGRCLAEDILADIPIPSFDNSAVDGYAVRSNDTNLACVKTPVVLKTSGEIHAGGEGLNTLRSRTAVRIMTGAPVPSGADAIVMLEDTFIEADGEVSIILAAQPEQHVRRAGEDIKSGTKVLTKGTFIRPAEIALMAMAGREKIVCYRLPQVAVISTGDEVVDINQGIAPPPGKIRNSNLPALSALVKESGFILHSQTHIPDDLDATIESLRICSDPMTGADVIVSAGGVSIGDRDFIKPALEKLGKLESWRVAMKPGKPVAFGSIGKTLFFGLPGNPVSAMVTFELFVRPALRKIAGRQPEELHRRHVTAKLLNTVTHTPGRREYVRAVTTYRSGSFYTEPTGAQGSGIISSLARSNSLMVVPMEIEILNSGERVDVILLD